MAGCSAFGCSNRSEKGFILKTFPRDPARRKIWEAKVNRQDWKPTNSSRLCEVHFPPAMWEKTREDGKRVLKRDAFPTIFSFNQDVQAAKPKQKAPSRRTGQELRALPAIVLDLDPQPSTSDDSSNEEASISPTTSASAASSVYSASPKQHRIFGEMKKKLQRYELSHATLLQKMKKCKHQIRCLNQKNKVLQKPKNDIISKVFSADQLLVLKRKSTKFFLKGSLDYTLSMNDNVTKHQSNNGSATFYNFDEVKPEVTGFVNDEQEMDYHASEEQSNEVDPLLHFNEEKPEEMGFVSDKQEINRIDLFDNHEVGNVKKMYLPNIDSVKMEMETCIENKIEIKEEFEEVHFHEEIQIKAEDEEHLEAVTFNRWE